MTPKYKFRILKDKSAFYSDCPVGEPLYGLPADVSFCQECVMSNQRPNSAVEYQNKRSLKKSTINLNEDGICDACRMAKYKNLNIDWKERERELTALCDEHRREDGRFDCVVPGSGGKDSFYASHILKTKYRMNPLTVTWAPHLFTDWGYQNFHAWLDAGFYNILHTPNPIIHRLLTRIALEELLHPFQPFMLGQKNIGPKIAAMYGIDLIFYGENEAEYGNPVALNLSPKQNKEFFASELPYEDMFVGGICTRELSEDFGLSRNDLEPYLPISQQALEERNIQAHHLGYYLKWHPQGCYYYAVENSSFAAAPERSVGTYSKYNSIDDKLDDIHFYTLFNKFGIGRATYDASQEIRNDEIDRAEGVNLVHRFDGEYPKRFMPELLEYLSLTNCAPSLARTQFEHPIIDEDYFQALCNSFKSPHLWKLDDKDHWSLRFQVSM